MKSGILSYRRKFPKELVRLIPSRSPTGRGRIELKVSLGSESINDPQARVPYAEAEKAYEGIVAKALRLTTQSFDVLDEHLMCYLVDTYVHDHLRTDEAMRWVVGQGLAKYETRGHPEDVYAECRALLES